MQRTAFRRIVLIAALLVSLTWLGAVVPHTGASAQDSYSCSWQAVGSVATSATYHMSGAFDSQLYQAFFYGGVGQTGSVQTYLAALDLADASLANAAGPARINPAGIQPRYGSVCFFRPGTGRVAGGDMYCVGGAGSATTGTGTDSMQDYNTTSGLWVANVNPAGTLGPRLFAAGAYDPVRDLVVIHGGTHTCATVGSGAADPATCTADALISAMLQFDSAGVPESWLSVSGTDVIGRVYLHSIVYDSRQQRMVAFGGTDNGTRPHGETFAMDLTGPDPTAATWAALATAGVPPARFGHAAAFNADKNWMIVYGGVSRAFQTSGETTTDTTWALDLGATPPTWMDLGATVGPLVGAGMVYDTHHKQVIMFGGRARYQRSGSSINRTAYALSCTPVVVPPTPVPSPTSSGNTVTYDACPSIRNRVPSAVISSAVANPSTVYGYGLLCSPSQPPSIYNVERHLLALANPGVPFHPLYNDVQWKCGCQ